MPNYTTNYNLKKPLQEEFYNVDDFNGNADIVDTELAKRPSVDELTGKLPVDSLPVDVPGGIPTLDSETGKLPSDSLPIGTANGVAGLDETGKLPTDIFPEGVGGGSGKRTSRYTVGSSAYGWTSSDCDYLCDGTSDEVEINAAIQALRATGGEVVLLDGTYYLTGSILMDRNNVTIVGNGNNTKLTRGWMGVYASRGMILVTADYCEVKNLYFDGVRGTYNDYYNNGVYTDSSSDNCRVEGCMFVQHGGAAILNNAECGILVHNWFENNDTCIDLSYGNQNVVSENTFKTNDYCIKVGSDGNIVSSNTMNTTTYYAIDLSSADNNTIVGNMSDGAKSGLYASYGTNSVIVGNTFINNTNYGVELSTGCTGNTVMGNTFTGNTSGDMYNYVADNAMGAVAKNGDTMNGTLCAGTSYQDPSSYLVRNQKLAAAEETPTVNGQICWVYK